jgi:hypothetical protein
MSEQNPNINQESPDIQPAEQNNQQLKANPLRILLQHKKLLGLFAVLVLLLILSGTFLFLSLTQNPSIDNNPTNSSPSPTQRSRPTDAESTQETLKDLPTPTPNNSKEAVEIKTQTKSQLDNLIEVEYSISRVKVYEEIWALIQVTNPDTDPANVLVKKEGGSWKVLLGPGTYFDNEELDKVGAPSDIYDDINFVGF